MSSLRPRPKADPKATLAAERAAARATRRQELARIIAEKQEQFARVKATNSGQASDEGYHQQKDCLRQVRIASAVPSGTSADEDRSTSSKPTRNKENQVPVSGSLQAAYLARRNASKVAPGSCQSAERRPSSHMAQRRAATVTTAQKARSEGTQSKDTHAIEDEYSFDLSKVDEMLKQETSEDMEEMYSFDLSKLSKVEHAPDQQLADESSEHIDFEELSMRSRRKSAPMHRDVAAPTGAKSKGENWQEAGMRQLAAENRELKENAARLEAEFKRLQSLASTIPSFEGEALQFAEMD